MKMRFSLATLLHLRKLREEQERTKLAAANLRKAKAAQDAERVESLLRNSRRVSVDADGGISGAQITFVHECCTVLGIHAKRAKRQAEHAANEALKQGEVYLAARRDFEVLESFRERQMKIFHTLEKRREQRDLDEAHRLTRGRRSGQALPIGEADVAGQTGTSNEMIQHENIGRKE